MKRRRFLSWFSVSTVLTLLSACSDAPVDSTATSPEAAAPRSDGFVEAGTLQELESNGSISVGANGQNIIVVQNADDPNQLYAVDSVCTHQGCNVNWDDQSQSLICPCHGSKFDAQGQVLAGPATEPIKSYTVKVEAGTVLVNLG